MYRCVSYVSWGGCLVMVTCLDLLCCLVLSSSALCCPRSGATAPCPVCTPVRGLFFLRRVRGYAKECCRGVVGCRAFVVAARGCLWGVWRFDMCDDGGYA